MSLRELSRQLASTNSTGASAELEQCRRVLSQQSERWRRIFSAVDRQFDGLRRWGKRLAEKSAFELLGKNCRELLERSPRVVNALSDGTIDPSDMNRLAGIIGTALDLGEEDWKDLSPRELDELTFDHLAGEEIREAAERCVAQSPPAPLLFGTHDILTALNVPPSDKNWKRIRRFSERHGGPIRHRGRTPCAEREQLLSWWESLDQEEANDDGRHLDHLQRHGMHEVKRANPPGGGRGSGQAEGPRF